MYRGRFAPTPSGPLHFGSLVAAAGSYVDARRHGGEWLVRMEDLDPPRVVPGAADAILRTLEAFGFEWDGPVVWQSSRDSAYAGALERLPGVYRCGCSRAGCIGSCREGIVTGTLPQSWRIRGSNRPIAWDDRLCRAQSDIVPDFVVRRADGIFAYHLAVVVDDAEQGITDVVRGADLLDSTARQIWLQRLLGYGMPRYLHLPIARNAAGEKLSKQTHAPAIARHGDGEQLAEALQFLGHPVPEELRGIDEIWKWAIPSQAATS